MNDFKSVSIIQGLQKKWNGQILVSQIIVSLAGGIFGGMIMEQMFHQHWIWIPVFSIIIFLVLWIFNRHPFTEKDISSFLNRVQPDLQESTELLLKPADQLNFLERLQVEKIAALLNSDVSQPVSIYKKVRASLLLLAVALLAMAAVYFFPFKKTGTDTTNTGAVIAEKKPAAVQQARITITPPAYTVKPKRTETTFNLSVEEDAQVVWQISTNKAVKQIKLVFNDKTELRLQATDANYTNWQAAKMINSPGFYQVVIDSVSSELYRIEMTRDQYPVIVVRSPKPNSLIEAGHEKKSLLEVILSDDYAVSNASISATIASGNGEAVKFKKQQLLFSDFTPGGKSYQLKKQLDLSALGMQPGDELYFYITARDSHNQEKRSDIYIIRIEDNAQLLSIEGLVNSVDVKPEFFRSQRQIIIETEQLLKDRDTMRVEVFKQRSNDLGIDQNLLRLRYGKFLGEETDAEIGHNHDDHDDHGGAATGNAQQMIDAVSHKHDNAEDATFFDAQTKKQLKATLDEMWKAELQLRTLQPKDALPFEYQALKLLKELQQQTRVYVAKTGSKTPPLKLEKRLTGELDKIIQPVSQQDLQQKMDDAVIERKALGILEQIRNKETLDPAALDILEKAGIQIGNKAAEEPAAYLSSFESFRKILGNHYTPADITSTAAALQKMLKAAPKTPVQLTSGADKKLSQRYFMNLNRNND